MASLEEAYNIFVLTLASSGDLFIKRREEKRERRGGLVSEASRAGRDGALRSPCRSE